MLLAAAPGHWPVGRLKMACAAQASLPPTRLPPSQQEGQGTKPAPCTKYLHNNQTDTQKCQNCTCRCNPWEQAWGAEEQPPSPPHCLLQGRPCLVNFKASAAFREGDVRGLLFPIFVCFLVSHEGIEKGLPWYSLSRHSQWFPPWHMPVVFTYLSVSTMQGISLVSGTKSRIKSPVFSCVVIKK